MPAQNEVDRAFNFKGDLTQGLFPHTQRTEWQFTKHLPSLLSLLSRGDAGSEKVQAHTQQNAEKGSEQWPPNWQPKEFSRRGRFVPH